MNLITLTAVCYEILAIISLIRMGLCLYQKCSEFVTDGAKLSNVEVVRFPSRLGGTRKIFLLNQEFLTVG